MTERMQQMRDVVKEQLSAASPEYAAISIMLGLFESLHTAKQSTEPLPSYEDDQQACLETFGLFVEKLRGDLSTKGVTDSRAKVKFVADAIWSKLSGVFSKEVLHAQHVSVFCHILQGKHGKGKRQLDCAGVVTTTLAAVQRLAAHEEHSDLQQCRLQLSFCFVRSCTSEADALKA
ncbi:hypothetical protein CVIRNUC_003774 [Coccomyxa viridis]|uniref:Uncharacterized protein n=1 Tax=Coccomyxa viridis TaxID=1274662 RepID=A0AAV1HZJ6_9CHLO|nr:hypothetical protein CVIRNUC_003774 [Coccomyxa viridis]